MRGIIYRINNKGNLSLGIKFTKTVANMLLVFFEAGFIIPELQKRLLHSLSEYRL
jgi:hypothetical protein